MQDYASYCRLGWALLKSEKYLESIDAFNQSLSLKENWKSLQGLGVSLNKIGQYQSAVEAFKKALILKDHWQSNRGLGVVLLNMKQYQLASHALEKSMQQKEDSETGRCLGEALLNLGVERLQCGRNSEAIKLFNQSLVLVKYWRSYQYLGIAQTNKKQYQSAISSFQKSLDMNDHWRSYYGLGASLLHTKQFTSAVDAFKNSLILKDYWRSYRGLGLSLLNIQEYQLAVDALEKSLNLKEDFQTRKSLCKALLLLGKEVESTHVMRQHVRNKIKQFHPEIDTCLGEKAGFPIARGEIRDLTDFLSKLEYDFYPSFYSEEESDSLLRSWRHLIFIHIPKCAGTSFGKALAELPQYISSHQVNMQDSRQSHRQGNQYLWLGDVKEKVVHDAYLKETFNERELGNLQGSYFSTHGAKFGIYDEELTSRGISAKKICLLRDPSSRFYSQVKYLGLKSNDKQELFDRCIDLGANIMDRYIYDYDLFEGKKESSYCQPFDYELCNSIDFLDINDSDLIAKTKSSFLTATLMPSIVQSNRLNDGKDRRPSNVLENRDFQQVYDELISKGFIERDIQIDLESLTMKTRRRIQFPEIIYKSEFLHPIIFVYPKTGVPKLMLTSDFIADPLRAIYG